MEHETQESVCRWAVDTFGDKGSHARVVSRAMEEMVELLVAVTQTGEVEQPAHKIATEAADVMIVMARFAMRSGHKVDFDNLPRNHWLQGADIPYCVVRANNAMAAIFHEVYECGNLGVGHLVDTVFLNLKGVIHACGLKPSDIVTEKMLVNRKRKWAGRNGDDTKKDGHGYHVKQGSYHTEEGQQA